MKNKKKLLRLLFGILVFSTFFLSVQEVGAIDLGDAEIIAREGGLYICSDTGLRGFPCIVATTLQILLSLAFVIALIFIVISGYRFITSQGNEELVTKAKKNLTWAITGVVLIVVAWVMLNVILDLFVSGDAGLGPPPSNSALPQDIEPPDLDPENFTQPPPAPPPAFPL